VSTPAILQVSQSTVRNRVIIFAHGDDGWTGAGVAGSLAAYAKEVALLRRVREQDVKIIADGVFEEDGAPDASVSNLQNAIETWANTDGQLGALTVFAVGQGSQEGLVCANGDAVTPEGWRYQASYHERPRVAGGDVAVCFGGAIAASKLRVV
jgi:hypothetical protein